MSNKESEGDEYVIGDIHGRKEALIQCLERSQFDYDKDTLIVLGDVCDGGYDTYECVEILLKIKNLIYILGNHDKWFIDHIATGWSENLWLHQGGANTIESYGGKARLRGAIYEPGDVYQEVKVPVTHQEFFNNVKYYHITKDKDVFVHGGFHPSYGPAKSDKHTLLWDRLLIEYAKEKAIKPWKRIFIGHTTTQTYGDSTIPLKFNNLWMIDTGAGWSGKLTIMNTETEEYWQSDKQKPAGR